jgi:hypothetical protein
MGMLNAIIRAVDEDRPIRPTLGDRIPIHVSRMIVVSLIDVGTAGEGLLFHESLRLGGWRILGMIKGDSLRTALESLAEMLRN